MRIVFITRKFPPSTGGMELFAHDLYGALEPKLDVKLVKWGGSNTGLPFAYPYLFLRAFWQLLKGGIDVIHIQDGVMALAGFVLSKVFRKPYVVVIHGLDITYDNWLYNLLFLPAIRRADQVICISLAAMARAEERGVSKSKLKVLTLAVKDNLYGESNRAELNKSLGLRDDSKILVTVGRLVERKGVAWFIRSVLPDLVAKSPEIVYLVVGEGAERKNIESAIADTNLGKNVRMLGRIDDTLYQSVYNGSDVFVMPNINVSNDIEGFGLVLLEASLCMLPIVASNTEGIKDAVIYGKNGILVDVKDSGAFVLAINSFLEDPKAAKTFGESSRNYTLKNYSWDSIADDYIKAYNALIAN